mmetsp:Transcript_22973/g.38456  ORF Transcript_22973/g.38456 Transcript_22973/m.38456 type:complete len:351 (+) Transcript_22973:95-1147(+)
MVGDTQVPSKGPTSPKLTVVTRIRDKIPIDETRKSSFKVRSMKVPPSQLRMEARIQEAVARRNKAAQGGSSAFGSSTDRSITPQHLSKREEVPDPGTYFDPEDTFVSEAKPHSPHANIVSKSLNTLWTRSTYERLFEPKERKVAKHLGVGTYSPHLSLDKSNRSGSVWLDTKHQSSSFATRSNRFSKALDEPVETPITQQMMSKHWLQTRIINYKSRRFTTKDVTQAAKGFLSEPPQTPGFIYETACPALPTIESVAKLNLEINSRIFVDRRARFPDAKFQYARPLGPDTYSFAWHQASRANTVCRIPPPPPERPTTTPSRPRRPSRRDPNISPDHSICRGDGRSVSVND